MNHFPLPASYEEDSDGTDLSEDENNQIIELESDSEAFDDGVVFVESGDEGIIEEEIVCFKQATGKGK